MLIVKKDRNGTGCTNNIIGTILFTGLSMNILYVGDKLPVQRGFFKNSAGDLLLALGFLGGLYNFCNFVIIFSLM